MNRLEEELRVERTVNRDDMNRLDILQETMDRLRAVLEEHVARMA